MVVQQPRGHENMSTAVGFQHRIDAATSVPVLATVPDAERKHRRRLAAASGVLAGVVVAFAVYGADYYRLSSAERPFSPKHDLLKPSGFVGINMALAGVFMFCGLFVYALRRRWLPRLGNSKHWLDYHVMLGIAGPVFVAFHSSFKFRGIAGFAFWMMLAVVLSGFIGRYFYTQIPARVSAAEFSLQEVREVQTRLARTFAGYRRVSVGLQAPFYLPTSDPALQFPALAKKEAVLSKRIVRLSRAQEVFRWWHVIHKPVSYVFVTLVVIHVAVAVFLGFA